MMPKHDRSVRNSGVELKTAMASRKSHENKGLEEKMPVARPRRDSNDPRTVKMSYFIEIY